MKPGRELDALIAEKVMGKQVGWQKFSHWHPGLSCLSFSKPSWSKIKFEGVKEIANERSNWREEWQEYGYLCPNEILMGAIPILFYSTNIASAWEVVEQLQTYNPFWEADGFLEFELSPSTGMGGQRGWYCNFGDDTTGAYADTAAHAICLAALNVMLIENCRHK